MTTGRQMIPQSLRNKILKRDKFKCQNPSCLFECDEAHSNYLEVHHCFAYCQYPEYNLEEWNLISLCGLCHKEVEKSNYLHTYFVKWAFAMKYIMEQSKDGNIVSLREAKRYTSAYLRAYAEKFRQYQEVQKKFSGMVPEFKDGKLVYTKNNL